MLGFTSATIVIFASLGLVALAFGLLARRYSFPALVIGLVGLLSLATASTWITLGLPGIIDQAAIDLKAKVATARDELEGLRGRLRPLDDQVRSLTSKNDQLQTKHAAVKSLLAVGLQQRKLEVERLNKAIEVERVGRAEAERKEAGTQTRLADALQQAGQKKDEAERLRNDLVDAKRQIAEAKRKLKTLEVQPPKDHTPAINSRFIRTWLGDQLDNHCYTSQSLERHELVVGLRGSWYVLRLKIRGKPLAFADGQFHIPAAEQEIKACARQLHKEVMGPVSRAAKSLQLFVRGGADSRPIVGQVEDPGGWELTFLPRQSDGSYASERRRQSVVSPLRNEDLPNLRADWLRQLIRPELAASGVGHIDILENSPGHRHERTADLLLYVEW